MISAAPTRSTRDVKVDDDPAANARDQDLTDGACLVTGLVVAMNAG